MKRIDWAGIGCSLFVMISVTAFLITLWRAFPRPVSRDDAQDARLDALEAKYARAFDVSKVLGPKRNGEAVRADAAARTKRGELPEVAP